MLLALSFVQLTSVILIVVLLFLGFKILETSWSYKISKPYKWETAVKEGLISAPLLKIERTYRDKVRFYSIWLQIERIKRTAVKGAFAEVGVYKGETALMMHHMDDTRKLYLFDTFEGFDNRDLNSETNKDERYTTTNFSDTNLVAVQELFKGNKNVFFFPGFFPETTKTVTEKTFAFVHVDADLYQPTIAALKYFYPKLALGGVILIHDYNHNWDGIKKAIDEFMVTIPESLIELTDWQGSAMIVKNRG